MPLLLLRAAVFSLFSLCSWIPLQAFRVRHLNPSTDAFCSSPITTRSRGDARVDAIGGSPRFGEVAARLINRPDPGWSFCWAGLCREAAWGTRVRARRKGLPPASFSCDAMCLRERAVDCRGAPASSFSTPSDDSESEESDEEESLLELSEEVTEVRDSLSELTSLLLSILATLVSGTSASSVDDSDRVLFSDMPLTA